MLSDQQLLSNMFDQKGLLEWEVFYLVFKMESWDRMEKFHAGQPLPQEVRTFCEQQLAATPA